MKAGWRHCTGCGESVGRAPASQRSKTFSIRLVEPKFNGLLVICRNSFEADDLSNIVSQNLTVKVVDGNFRVQLVPTTDSNPPASYSVKYNSDGKFQFPETWGRGHSDHTAENPRCPRVDLVGQSAGSSQPDSDPGERRRGIDQRSGPEAGKRSGL